MATLNKTMGSSKIANDIDKINQNNSQYFSQSAVLGKRSAYNELIELWDECQSLDWDGYGALPVEEKTFQNAWAVINALPLSYPLPSLDAEPDGHITLEWYRHPRWLFSISVSPEGYLYYAALFGEDSTNRSEFFLGEISTRIINLIEQVNFSKI